MAEWMTSFRGALAPLITCDVATPATGRKQHPYFPVKFAKKVASFLLPTGLRYQLHLPEYCFPW